VKPSELAGYAEDYSLKVKDITGLVYNPLIDVFSLSDSDIDVNYFMSATRNLEKQASK
jgi:2-polyprenyl-6-hydroxyphenyl methylase/3-demethylubiquinone-9 3-methyltransferase